MPTKLPLSMKYYIVALELWCDFASNPIIVILGDEHLKECGTNS